jgi:hypothetical protein
MKLKILALIAAAAMSWCGVARAAMTSSFVDESIVGQYSTTYVFSDQATNASASEFSLRLFDMNKGTLKSVDLTLDGVVVGELRVKNGNPDARTFSNLQASAPVSLKVSLDGINLSATAATTVKVPSYILQGNTAADIGGPEVAVNASTQYAQPLDLSSFQAVGEQYTTALFNVTAGRGTVRGNLIFNTSYGFVGLGNGSLKVNYTYSAATPDVSAVPVPASAWLMGSGVLAMGAFMRRRRGERAPLAF